MARKRVITGATGAMLSALLAGTASVLSWQCRGDGCLGLLLLWIVGGLVAIVATLGVVISGLIAWKREGEFPDDAFWWMFAPSLSWGAAFLLAHAPGLLAR